MENINLARRYFIKNAMLSIGSIYLFSSHTALEPFKPVADEKNMKLHFEALFNKSSETTLKKAVNEMI